KPYHGEADIYDSANTKINTQIITDKLQLAAGQYAVIKDIPVGTNVVVEEDVPNGYTTPKYTFNGAVTNSNRVRMTIVSGENKLICTNSNRGKITVTKTIDQNWAPHGDPIFIFKLERLDAIGNVEVTYSDYVRFTGGASGIGDENYENRYTEGLNPQSITFDNLPMGRYRLTEEQSIRYQFAEIADYSNNGTIDQNNNQALIFTLGGDAPDGSATFHNTEFTDGGNEFYSHTDAVKNTFTLK
ncbi:MAG: DUF5979 domain-containing protein, partial [Clostridiales bacterium]